MEFASRCLPLHWRPGRRRRSHLGGLRFTTYSYTRETASCGLDSLAALHFLQPGNHLKSFVKIAALSPGNQNSA